MKYSIKRARTTPVPSTLTVWHGLLCHNTLYSIQDIMYSLIKLYSIIHSSGNHASTPF